MGYFLGLLIFIFLLAANITYLVAKRRTLSLSNIGDLFIVYWVANFFLGIVIFSNEHEWNFYSLIFLLICVDVFALSCSMIGTHKKRYFLYYETLKLGKQQINHILMSCFFAGLGYVYMELSSNGFNMSVFLSFSALIESGYYFTDGRYGNTELEVPLLGQIFLAICYSGFVLSGYVYKLNIVRKYLCFILFIPMSMTAIATTAKTTLISGVFLWMCGYLIASNYDKQKKVRVNIVSLKKMVPVIALFGGVIFITFVVRYDSVDSFAIFNRIFVYAFGHLPCYDDWFSRFPANLFGYSYGHQSMQAIFGSKIPLELRQIDVVPSLETTHGWTNVNTMFAYILMDFGYIGSIIFFFLFGLIAQICLNYLKNGKGVFKHILSGLSFYIVLYSFLICPLKYTTIILAFVFFGAYLYYFYGIKQLHRGNGKC